MSVDNRHFRIMIILADLGNNIKIRHILLQCACTISCRRQFSCLLHVFRLHGFQDFQLSGCIAAYDTKDRCHINASLTIRIWYRHTLDILNDIAATAHLHMIREFTQNFSCFGRCISNGDGFCTAQCRHQFILQYLHIIVV